MDRMIRNVPELISVCRAEILAGLALLYQHGSGTDRTPITSPAQANPVDLSDCALGYSAHQRSLTTIHLSET